MRRTLRMAGTEQTSFQASLVRTRETGWVSGGSTGSAIWQADDWQDRLAVSRHLAHLVQRISRPAGSHVVDAGAQPDSNRVGALCLGTGSAAALACTACAGIRAAGVNPVRYRKGMIALSETRDYPLLRRVLHSSFVTPAQLYEFMKLDYCVSSRNAFDNRLRRLLHHDLLVRHEDRK